MGSVALLFIYLLVVSILVTVINFTFAKMPNTTNLTIIKYSLYLLPLQYLVGLLYAFYYANGIKYFSYATLTTSAYPITIIFGILIHFFILKNHSFSTYELIGLTFTSIGMFFLIISKF